MFKISCVDKCPVTEAGLGRLRIPAAIIADIAGSVEKEKGVEWCIVMQGTRSEDGMVVEIEGVTVPQDQVRSTANVKISGYEVGDRDVCHGHSHHGMGAFFSGEDKSSTNTRFASAIVFSSKIETFEDQLLGFSYKAEGRVTLPCGGMGVVEFKVDPIFEGGEVWPFERKWGWNEVDPKSKIGDCGDENWDVVEEKGWTSVMKPRCGLVGTKEVVNEAVFGKTHEIYGLLPKAAAAYTTVTKPSSGGYGYAGGYGYSGGYKPADDYWKKSDYRGLDTGTTTGAGGYSYEFGYSNYKDRWEDAWWNKDDKDEEKAMLTVTVEKNEEDDDDIRVALPDYDIGDRLCVDNVPMSDVTAWVTCAPDEVVDWIMEASETLRQVFGENGDGV